MNIRPLNLFQSIYKMVEALLRNASSPPRRTEAFFRELELQHPEDSLWSGNEGKIWRGSSSAGPELRKVEPRSRNAMAQMEPLYSLGKANQYVSYLRV
jgi:hypothetical protein